MWPNWILEIEHEIGHLTKLTVSFRWPFPNVCCVNTNRSKEKSAEGFKEQTTTILSKFDKEFDYQDEALSSTLFVHKLGLSNVYPALLMNGLVYGSNQVYFNLILLTPRCIIIVWLALLGRLGPHIQVVF